MPEKSGVEIRIHARQNACVPVRGEQVEQGAKAKKVQDDVLGVNRPEQRSEWKKGEEAQRQVGMGEEKCRV